MENENMKKSGLDMGQALEQFEEVSELTNLKVLRNNLARQRPITTNRGTMNVEKLCSLMIKDLSRDANKYPIVWEALHDLKEMEKLLFEYSKVRGILHGGKVEMEIPPDMQGAILNMDITATKESRFFLTHSEKETVLKPSGDAYILLHQMSPAEAAAQARKVVPEYMPRGERGITVVERDGITNTLFNLYTPPSWVDHPKWETLPDELPSLFLKLVRHLFPLEIERSYLYAWLYESWSSPDKVDTDLCGTG